MEVFRAAHGVGADWLAACRAWAEQLDPAPKSANLGFVYVNGPLAPSLNQIAARLREVTGIRDWVGAGGVGVCTSGQEDFERGAVVALVGALPERGFSLFDLQLDGQSGIGPGCSAVPRQTATGRGRLASASCMAPPASRRWRMRLPA